MTVAATVLIPTHDHGPTLLRSIRSALAQTVADVEVLVVGDGAPDVTRELVAELAAADPRVRFFDNPKGPRHGELHRHAALREARGEVVCYLCDDDLWLPGHVEYLRELLSGSDFAYSLPFWIDPAGEVHALRVDLDLAAYREQFAAGENRIPLSCAGHTLELYRRLPEGWRTTPAGIPTDLYMWQQILAVPGLRVAGGARPTVVHLPSPERTGWSGDQRLEELDRWAGRLADPSLPAELAERVLAATAADAAALEAEFWARGQELERTGSWARELAAELEHANAEHARIVAGLQGELEVIASSATWRLRERLLSLPASGPIRAAARVLAGRVAR